MEKNNFTHHSGLTGQQVIESRAAFGTNDLKGKDNSGFLRILTGIVTEPMFILFLVATFVYFILEESAEGFMMLVAIFIVSLISFYQETKTSNALKLLHDLSSTSISESLAVSKDTERENMFLEERLLYPASGYIL